jgi:hypothetical protein
MTTWREWLKRWDNAYAYVGLIVLAGFWMMDGITVYRPPVAPNAASTVTRAAVPPKSEGRVFILMLDSLRYETATSGEYMPYLARLRERAVWAEVRPSYNAITVPCLRAAFTGRDEVSVLSFVQNFLHGDAAIESFFSQFTAAGRHTAVFSDGSFLQFGPAIAPSFTTSLVINSVGVEDYDDEAVRRGLALFGEKQQDIVIVHVRYSDYAAHKFHVGAPGYRADFGRVDRLVELADRAVTGPDTLIVMGDHGHALDGTHSLGQDIPTFALWRGPKFKRGFDLGTIDITSHRWFLGELFGLTLPADGYMGGRYPAAFAGAPVTLSQSVAIVLPALQAVPPVLWWYFALLIVLGAGLVWPERAPWMQARGAGAAVWLALPAAALPLPWNAWAGTAAATAVVGWLLRGKGWRAWLPVVAAVAIAAGWHEWGHWLAAVRDRMHEVTARQLAAGWLALGVGVVSVANRANRRVLVSTIAIAAGFLALPTNFRYGFTGLMVPLLWLWLAAYGASLVREGRLRTRVEIGWAAGSLVAIFGFTQAFAGTESTHFIFRHFVPVVPPEPFDRGLLLWWALVWGGVAAKCFLFFPDWPRRWWPVLAKVAVIVLLQAVQWRTWEPGGWASAGLMAVLMGGWLANRRRDAELAHAFALGLLFFLFVYCVRPERETYARADCLLAGLMLAARWLRRWPQAENTASDYTVLGVVAFLAAGFFSVSWSIEKLEWSRIYTWFPANWVEAGAVVLVPWIVAKTALPLFIARTVLGRELRGQADWPGENLRRLAGLKLLTLLLVLTGLGQSGTVNNVYLEGAQQLTVLLILWVGQAGWISIAKPEMG